MYHLGKKSKRHLVGVNPELAFFVTELIKTTKQDFTVFEGLRLKERQHVLVARGVSWTMNSKHLTGNAVDLVVWHKGKPYWDNVGDMTDIDKAYALIGQAGKEVIKKYNLNIGWGYELWGKDQPHWQIRDPRSWDITKIYDQDSLKHMINS